MSQPLHTHRSSNSAHPASRRTHFPTGPRTQSPVPSFQQSPALSPSPLPNEQARKSFTPPLSDSFRPNIAGQRLSRKPVPRPPPYTSQSSEDLQGNDEIRGRSGLIRTATDISRSSLDSQKPLQNRPEEGARAVYMNDDNAHLQQSQYLDGASTSMRVPINTSRPSKNPAVDPPSPGRSSDALRSNNPYRRATSDREFTGSPQEARDGLDPKQGTEDNGPELYPKGKTPVEIEANFTLPDQAVSEYPSSYHHTTLDPGNASPNRGPLRNAQASALDFCHPGSSTQFEKPVEDNREPLSPSTDTLKYPDTQSVRPSLSNNVSHDRTGSWGNVDKELPPNPPPENTASGDLHFSHQREAASAASGTKSHNRAIDAEIAKLGEQRNETYQIKHFNWFDYNRRTLRRSSMLTQNNNGPCPLLALVNALILEVEDDSRSALGAALRAREQVSLGLIIESLMDELISEGRGSELIGLPDVDELNRFLLMLHTGMTANPLLSVPAPSPPNLMDSGATLSHLPLSLNDDVKPGRFEDTQEIHLYAAFAVPLVHGWLAPRSDPARAAFARSARSYEDAQTILFRENELEEKMSQAGLTLEEEHLLQDMGYIKTFLESYPTQITPYGLDTLNRSLFPGAFAILFRNSHFSTIYKHPESGLLYTLVTDAGYSDKDEVIWESLVDVSGQKSGFFSGDFRPVGGGTDDQDAHQSQPLSAAEPEARDSMNSNGLASPASPPQDQEQADADYAMALQLHEEEAAARLNESRDRPAANRPPDRRTSASNTNRSRQQRDPIRPSIPPRGTRANANATAVSTGRGVSTPIEPSQNSDEHNQLHQGPPPAYEEAAKSRPYLPPLGHPQHPSFDGRSPASPTFLLTPTTSNQITSSPAPSSSLHDFWFPFESTNPGSHEASGPGPDPVSPVSGGLRRPTAPTPIRVQTHNSNNGLGSDANVSQGHAPRSAKDRGKDCVVM